MNRFLVEFLGTLFFLYVILATNITFVRIDEMGDAIPISGRVKEKLNK